MSRCLPLTIAILLACAQAYEDFKDSPVRIAGDENAVITGELDKYLVIRCLAYGYPIPKVFWTRNNRMVPFNNTVYETRGNSLLIRSLGIDTLGQYTCVAYNEIGGAASWEVLVRAYRPESRKHDYLVARNSITTTGRIPLSTTLETTFTSTTTTTTERPVFFTESTTEETTSEGTSTSEISTSEGSITEGSISKDSRERSTSEGSTSEGCTSESSTCKGSTSESTSEGISSSRESSTHPEGCVGSKFGCCYDNDTEASGPDMQGCPCTATEFGCCPDGVSPAHGKNNKGCQAACRNSKYGCCSDDLTPAHGPDFKGCCLLTAFGCCPDNRKAAEGPNLEGCRCQHVQHGCCSDNVTAARGPNNEGCGCQYTELGCCPDRHKVASGPDFEGCSCLTYQFGCCPDGFTIATSPDQLSCLCEYSTYRCCGDAKTPATGPNGAGCDCSTSKYGCCPDGKTEAAGSQFLGCPNVPENKQAVCSLSADTGPCTNYTIMYFYDRSFGGCSRFWYGGCEGNGNKFTIKKHCDNICVRPAPKDVCKLPDVEGPCDEDLVRWYYNNTREQCLPFRYGGCLGNANNFDSRELCQTNCEPDKTTESTTEETTSEGTSTSESSTSEGSTSEVSTSDGSTSKGSTSEGSTSKGYNSESTSEGISSSRESSTLPEGCVGSKFGCCYENGTEASGPDMHGCPCTATEFGCCSDGVSPAQGKNNKGCQAACRNSKYGCCSDDQSPAHGPDFEGCCLLTTFGCCPDNHKAAEGPHLEGCRCQHAQHGCCLDNVTTARGPNNEGCGCQYTEFGCCPDRHTVASGPNFEGCSCHTYQFGCCPNGVTIATSPDLYNCRCEYYTYGCCGDAKTPATGPNGAGCDCSTSKYECCPDGQTEAVGPQFLGCANVQKNKQDTCNLPIEQGPCAGNFSRWGYNSESRACKQFIWGGCEGNTNQFKTEAACQLRCATHNVVCSEQQEAGNCGNKVALWSFSQTENRCVPFYYNGCGGNGNRFETRESCEQFCPSVYVPDECTLPAEAGIYCSEYRLKWFYDTGTQRCRQFYYGGCGGNKNNFDTANECSNACSEPVTTTITSTTIRPTQPQSQTEPRPQPGPEPDKQSFCFLEIDAGVQCSLALVATRYAYNSTLGKCVTFQYNGCGGNQNNFPNEKFCTYYCYPVQDVCQLPMMTGTCEDSLMSWFYDNVDDSCSQFTYSGCDGNGNRFYTREDCESRCKLAVTTTTAVAHVVHPEEQHECETPSSLAPCGYNITVFYYDSNSKRCLPSEFGGCRHLNSYRSEEKCERQCGAFRGVDTCQAPPDPGPCRNPVMKYYFDSLTGRCQSFTYGGCAGGPNRFSTFNECEEICGESGPAPACLQEVSTGYAEGCAAPALPRYHYSAWRGDCILFTYEGCGGNDNNFPSYSHCQQYCTTSDTCQAPPDPGPCRNPVMKYYFDSLTGRCQSFTYGGCAGGPNRFSTFNECEKICGESGPAPACLQEVSTGYAEGCAAPALPRYYYSAWRGDCILFMYEGCGGNDNNFPSYSHCQQYCTTSVPVSVHMTTKYSTLNIGTELRLACELDGFPEPTVYWTKDGQRLVPDERTSITGNTISRLAISRVTVSDSGSYGCHADNEYSSHSDNAQINVQQLTVPANCTDNPSFANCDLIVRSKFCNHKYYSKYCCKSCVEAGQLDPQVVEAQADQPYRKK